MCSLISFTCRFDKITYFNMRGLCTSLYDLMDGGFVADMESIKRNNDKGIEFTGYTKSKIILNKETNRWNVVSLVDGSSIMYLDFKVSHTYFYLYKIHNI